MESMNSFDGFSCLGSDVTDLVVRFCPSPDQRLLLRLSKYLRASVLRVLPQARELTGDSARLVLTECGSADNVVHLDLEGDEYPVAYLSQLQRFPKLESISGARAFAPALLDCARWNKSAFNRIRIFGTIQFRKGDTHLCNSCDVHSGMGFGRNEVRISTSIPVSMMPNLEEVTVEFPGEIWDGYDSDRTEHDRVVTALTSCLQNRANWPKLKKISYSFFESCGDYEPDELEEVCEDRGIQLVKVDGFDRYAFTSYYEYRAYR
eukprot:211616_1